jgi:hypothetical protein
MGGGFFNAVSIPVHQPFFPCLSGLKVQAAFAGFILQSIYNVCHVLNH